MFRIDKNPQNIKLGSFCGFSGFVIRIEVHFIFIINEGRESTTARLIKDVC